MQFLRHLCVVSYISTVMLLIGVVIMVAMTDLNGLNLCVLLS